MSKVTTSTSNLARCRVNCRDHTSFAIRTVSAGTKNQTHRVSTSDSSANTKPKNIIHGPQKRQARRERGDSEAVTNFKTLTFPFQERTLNPGWMPEALPTQAWGTRKFRRTVPFPRYESASDGSGSRSKPGMPSARNSRRKPVMRHCAYPR